MLYYYTISNSFTVRSFMCVCRLWLVYATLGSKTFAVLLTYMHILKPFYLYYSYTRISVVRIVWVSCIVKSIVYFNMSWPSQHEHSSSRNDQPIWFVASTEAKRLVHLSRYNFFKKRSQLQLCSLTTFCLNSWIRNNNYDLYVIIPCVQDWLIWLKGSFKLK